MKLTTTTLDLYALAADDIPFGQIESKRKRRHPKLIVAPIPSLKLFLRQPKYSSSRLHSASFCDGSPFRFLSSSAHHTQHCLCGNVHPHDRGFAFPQRLDRNKVVERDFEEIEAECLSLTTWTKQQQQEQQPPLSLNRKRGAAGAATASPMPKLVARSPMLQQLGGVYSGSGSVRHKKHNSLDASPFR
ncbi:hypothetical protein IV203_011319 [Nitzschia inconspicua]|uniref:Uncharacterized protein n=1 Tax=Nitzschia inconspicua TaxID=303405 RepID=A0A9K3KT31_9STRA|nr:hypothetical protein IV203_011317 [Nitzschia inconspicua]KAG7348722.1 hypothetical protein IV203_011319 [Nitzschia inconspicua]